jgi:hypothetical protein
VLATHSQREVGPETTGRARVVVDHHRMHILARPRGDKALRGCGFKLTS